MDSQQYMTVAEVAKRLGVSQSWVRRHKAELPVVRCGRLVRFDSLLLSQHIQATMPSGKPLKPRRTQMFNRNQRGRVHNLGKKKVRYGMYREDVKTPTGQNERPHTQIPPLPSSPLPTPTSTPTTLSHK